MYSSWATKQRTKFFLVVGGVGFVIFSLYILINMYKSPTCFDFKMNQDEVGVDCGGVCSLMCDSQILPLNTVWVRSFEAGPGFWSAFAYIENQNVQAEVREVSYRFSLFDRSNNLIVAKEGKTFITQDTLLPLFLSRLEVGDAQPYKTTFEWLEPLVWHRSGAVYSVALEEQELKNVESQPEIHAVLVNKEPYPLKDIEVVALVYDKDENAIAVSKTYVDSVSARGRSNIRFVWSTPFEKEAKRWQLIARVPKQEE
jgi:hypothetical protein